jgi:archaellum component FlaC
MNSETEMNKLRNNVNTLVMFVEEISRRLMEFSEDLKTIKSRHHDFIFDTEYEINNLRREMKAMEEKLEHTM